MESVTGPIRNWLWRSKQWRSIEYARQMQKECASRYLLGGKEAEFALLGVSDWFREEILIQKEFENGRFKKVAR